MSVLSRPPGADISNIYITTHENAMLFDKGKEFSYFTIGSRQNVKSGVVEIKGASSNTLYICVANPDLSHGIHIAIEAVALVRETIWSDQEVKEMNIQEVKVPYLKALGSETSKS